MKISVIRMLNIAFKIPHQKRIGAILFSVEFKRFSSSDDTRFCIFTAYKIILLKIKHNKKIIFLLKSESNHFECFWFFLKFFSLPFSIACQRFAFEKPDLTPVYGKSYHLKQQRVAAKSIRKTIRRRRERRK